MAIDPHTRDCAIRLMRRGQLTVSQAARRAGVSRQAALSWARGAKIDLAAAAELRADRIWRRAIMGYRRAAHFRASLEIKPCLDGDDAP